MSRWRCARWCCPSFTQATEHQPYHLCAKTGRVDAYVVDTSPVLTVAQPPAAPVLRAVA